MDMNFELESKEVFYFEMGKFGLIDSLFILSYLAFLREKHLETDLHVAACLK